MPIIFISGAPPEDLHVKVGNGSDVKFLRKPFGGAVLIEAIQTMLKPPQQSGEPVISGSPTVCRIFHSFSTVNADTTAAIQALNATTQQSEYNAMLSTTWQLAELKPDLAGLFDSSTVNVFCGLYTGASRDFQGPGCPYFNPTVPPNLPPPRETYLRRGFSLSLGRKHS
jgi:hypothetical protein